MRTKFLLVAVVVLAFTGCTTIGTTLDTLSGRGVVSEHTSGFDNSTVIEVSPEDLADPQGYWTGNMELGARWTSASPNTVALTFYMAPETSDGGPITSGPNAVPFTTLVEVYINVDGTITHFTPGGQAQNGATLRSSGTTGGGHNLYASNEVAIPYMLFEKMLSAKMCRLRAQSRSGVMDFDLTRTYMEHSGKPTAVTPLRNLLAKVAAARQKA